jgi:hypothetical protein
LLGVGARLFLGSFAVVSHVFLLRLLSIVGHLTVRYYPQSHIIIRQ